MTSTRRWACPRTRTLNINGVVTRTAKRRVTEVRFTPIPAPAEKEDDHDREKWLPSRHLQNHN